MRSPIGRRAARRIATLVLGDSYPLPFWVAGQRWRAFDRVCGEARAGRVPYEAVEEAARAAAGSMRWYGREDERRAAGACS